MRASVRSTWLAVGPGHDSLLLSQQNKTGTLPAPLALLWSSDLVVLHPHSSPTSIQIHLTFEGSLWSLACQDISLGDKSMCLLRPAFWNSFILYPSPPTLYVCATYIFFFTCIEIIHIEPNSLNLLIWHIIYSFCLYLLMMDEGMKKCSVFDMNCC